MTKEQFFDLAVQKIESKSIQEWANKNREIWIKSILDKTIEKYEKDPEVINRFACFMTLTAMG
jgi:hypothetical protein